MGDRGNKAHLALQPACDVESLAPDSVAQQRVDSFGKDIKNS
jgi:hypothetical protein